MRFWQRLGLLAIVLVIGLVVLAACGNGGGGNSTVTRSTGAETTSTTMGGMGTVTAGATKAANTPAKGSTSPTTSGPGAANWKSRNASANLTGSGSSFVDPIMQTWIEAYKGVASNTSINYQSTGSGQGKKDFISGVTDFGGTDAVMTDEELAQAPDALHIPVILGAVTMIYNLQGVDNLQFSGETLARMFLGEITTWNDPAIAADNPGVTLPNTPVTIVHRSDGSGTTAIFTDYLSKVNTTWKDNVGSGTAVQWPTGIGAEKNPGVAAGVQQTPGAIGYVELIYALSNNLPVPAIKNNTGAFVKPTIESTSAAAAGALNNMPDDLRVSITNPQQGADAYPIAGFTWLLVRGQMNDQAKAQALTDFIYWALTQGSDAATKLNYAPLPDVVRQKAIAKLSQVTVNGQPVFTAP